MQLNDKYEQRKAGASLAIKSSSRNSKPYEHLEKSQISLDPQRKKYCDDWLVSDSQGRNGQFFEVPLLASKRRSCCGDWMHRQPPGENRHFFEVPSIYL
jgi:hypothetical protein